MKQLPIWKKALFGIGFILFVCIGIFLFNIRMVQQQTQQLVDNLEHIEADGAKLSLLNQLSKEVILTNVGYMDAIVDKSSGEVDKDIVEQHKNFHSWFKENEQALLKVMPDDEAKEDFKKTVTDLKVWGETADKLFISIAKKDSDEVFAQYDDVLDSTVDVVLKRNDRVIKILEHEYQDFVKKSKNMSSSTVLIEWISISIIASVGLLVLWLLVKNINQSLNSITDRLKESADKLKVESDSVSHSSTSLSEAATEQAASLQETVSSVDEISSMVQRNADAANSSTQVSLKSTDAASRGKKTVEAMIDSIREITNSNDNIMTEVQNSNDEISKIVHVISEIGEKTKVINDIVFQTKLLSFNASVEAARAGEHGKGFAVVAEEVGNLASMSGKAAQEITEMLDKSIKQVTGIVESSKSKIEGLMKVGKAKVEDGEKRAEECGQALDEILQNVDSVNEMIREISTASSEQASGIKEITKAMQELDRTTHQNSSIATQSSQMSKSLQDQAMDLAMAVESLAQVVGQNSHAASATPSSVNHHKKSNHSNLVEFRTPQKSNHPAKSTHSFEGVKVSGSDVVLPAEDDPRFEDL